jgi:Ca-activated chloride channel family protein
LHVQKFSTVEKFIVGKYDLEILTLPRIKLSKVDIAQSKTTTIEVPQSGSVSIAKPTEGPGSLYIEQKNKLEWVCNLNSNLMNETLVLQPGRYRIEFRPRNAKESIYTIEKSFKVESGLSTAVNLY